MSDVNIKIKDLFSKSNVYDKEKKWWFINRLWYFPEIRNDFYKIIELFWEKHQIDISPNHIIIYPEGMASSFGALPFISHLIFKYPHELVIWKELGDMLTASPRIFPELELLSTDKKCIIFQDVLSGGSTIRKMEESLKLLNYEVTHYLAILQLREHESDLRKNLDACIDVLSDDFIVDCMFTENELL